MKILLVTPEYPPHNIGGGGIVVQSIAQTLISRGHDVKVVSGYYPARSFFKKVAVTHDRQVKVFWLPLTPAPKTSLHLKTVMPPNIFSILYIMRIFFALDFDVIHLHGFGHLFIDFVALICRMKDRRYVLTLHGFPRSPLKGGSITRLLYHLYFSTLGKSTLLNAEKATAVSSAVKGEATAYGVGEDKIAVIPNGLDLSKYAVVENNKEFRKKYGIKLNDRLIVAVGILHERKGFQYLIEAASLLKKRYDDVKFLIIGKDGGAGQQLKELVKQLQVMDEVIFTGFLDFKTKLIAISEAETFVIPSLAEPFGLVALEGMAIGKAIVATKVGGLKEILRNKQTAMLIKSRDSQHLGKAIIKILEDKDLRLRLSENSGNEVLAYDWHKIVNSYIELYCEIL